MINIAFQLTYLEAFLIFINIISFLVYFYDKFVSIKNNTTNKTSRISEKMLLTIAFIGGTVGAIVSMFMFRHKIKKLSFMIKFILVISLQIIIYILLINDKIQIENIGIKY
jgi:uncharacterized membrane protein YsdA (DUF1294 family)